jgi:hypothetical protein
VRSIALLLVGLLAFVASACISVEINGDDADQRIVGSGDLVSDDFQVDGFTRLNIANTFAATVRASDVFTLTITADDNLMDSVEVQVSGDTLEIRVERGLSLNNATLRAEITMPELDGVELSGASSASIEGFGPASAIELTASGASSFDADVDTDRLDLELSGASSATIRGFAAVARLDASGASRLLLRDLRIEECDVQLSGASTGNLSVLDQLDADVSGASRLEYDGDPELGDINTSGGSSITRS